MEKEKLSWDEMKKKYPDEWLLIADFELDKFGEVSSGVVERHAKDMNGLLLPSPLIDRDTASRYTGESTFVGLRSHAQHDHTI